MSDDDTRKGRARDYVRCYNCDGYVGKGLLREERYDNECPLCGAEGLLDV